MGARYLLDTNIAIALINGDPAIAIQHDLILITRDSDFDAIDGLNVERW